MKRVIAAIVAGLALMAAQAFAGNGDLIVDGKVQVGPRNALTATSWGYSPSWKVLMLGSTGTNYLTDATTISLGYDPIGNPNGAFTGNGGEILTRNIVRFVQPNSSNNGYYFPLRIDNGILYLESGAQVTSDKRFKKNLAKISDPLSKVVGLEGLSYELDEDFIPPNRKGVAGNHKKSVPLGRHFGVIAQDLEKVFPELVREDLDGMKSVSYEGLIPVLIEAIKEQQKMIEALKQEVAQMKK